MRSWLPAAFALFCISCSGACGSATAPTPTAAHANATPTPPPPPDASISHAAAAHAGALDQGMAASFWTTPDEQAGATAFGTHDWATALASFQAARASIVDPHDPRAGRLELMIGLCAAELGNHADAAKHLLAARDALPELADYIGYHAARSLWLAHDRLALDIARSVAKDSIVGPDAEILVGDLLTASAADKPTIAAYYRDYLARHPNGPFRSEARFDLADALSSISYGADEPKLLLRQITIDDPLSSWATKAAAALKTYQNVQLLTGAEHIAQGMVFFDNQRNDKSEDAFAEALADPALSAADHCVAAYHRAQSRFKARDRKGAAPLFDDASAACKTAGNADLQIKSEYQAGRSYAFIGQHDVAITHYQAAEAIDPAHSYADDALLREGEEWASLGSGAQVEAALSAMPQRFPHGDNLAEAMWRLGFRAWREQRYDDAIKWWQQQIALVPYDDNWFGAGQPQYWLGRAYAAKKQLPAAIAAWTQAVKLYPAAYYALLALNRIHEVAPRDYDKLLAEISADPPGYDPKAPALSFAPRPEWSAPGFARAMLLLRLGLGEPAEHELAKLGLAAPEGRKPVTDPDQLDKLWALAFLYDRADAWATSVATARWYVLDYRKQWPVGANRAKWQIAYPKGYWSLLTKHAALNHVPIAMQVAIVREESGFDPLDESYANAIGLTQMIPPTAKDFSKGTGIDPTRENLRDPEKNVTIGSRFLGSLFKDWHDYVLLVPPSYNAGPAGVRKMLRVRGTWDADEFVEGIVDDQARNYTKRVLGTFFTYTWLYQHEVPTIPNQIPSDLLPKSK